MNKQDPWQAEFNATAGNKLLCSGRQIGKSETCGKDAGDYAIKHADETTLMIAPTERQAYELFTKTLDYILEVNPKMIKKGKDRPTQTKMKLTNGHEIYCLPVGISGLGIRGLTIHRLYADEAARIPDEVWNAVTPMLLTTAGDRIYLSTPAGKSGHFYETYKSTENDFKKFYLTSEQVIAEREICETWTEKQRDKALAYLKTEKARMSELEYGQEYMGLFLDELRQFFPTLLIKSCMTLRGDDKYHALQNSNPLGDFFFGADIARMGGDETVLISVHRNNRKSKVRMVGMEVYTKTTLTDTYMHTKTCDIKHNYKKIYLDDGGLGIGVYEMLINDEQTRRKTIALNNASRSVNDEKNKGLLKEDLYNNLLVLMEQGKIDLWEDDRIIMSLMSVQSEYVNGKIHIFGNYTHIAEALIRAAWCMKDKSLNIWIA